MWKSPRCLYKLSFTQGFFFIREVLQNVLKFDHGLWRWSRCKTTEYLTSPPPTPELTSPGYYRWDCQNCILYWLPKRFVIVSASTAGDKRDFPAQRPHWKLLLDSHVLTSGQRNLGPDDHPHSGHCLLAPAGDSQWRYLARPVNSTGWVSVDPDLLYVHIGEVMGVAVRSVGCGRGAAKDGKTLWHQGRFLVRTIQFLLFQDPKLEIKILPTYSIHFF